jgi:DNA-3-methyladenine glycosylase I
VSGIAVGADGVARCGWAVGDPLYERYHDHEWGRPVLGDQATFELLTLEGFQAGLAWITILRKRTSFREAFAGFEPRQVAAFDDGDVERLLRNDGIVRHRGKIEAAIGNARVALELPTGLSQLVWSYAPAPRGRRATSLAEIPASTAESAALSKELKRHGFRFVGPTTVYAFMQAAGLVDDHLEGCAVPPPRRPPVAAGSA